MEKVRKAAVAGLLFLCAGAGCRRAPREERALLPPDFIQSESVPPIEFGAQGTVHDFIRIGVGYIADGRFSDEHGTDRRGLVAGLWIYVRRGGIKNKAAKVHAGQRIEAAGYRFFVEEIQGGGAGFVRLRVLAPQD